VVYDAIVGTFQLQNNIPNVTVNIRPRVYNVAVSGCPANFMYLQRHNLCYYLFEMNLRWQSASQYCRALDSRAHLVVIDTEDEQEVIANGLSENPSK